MSDQTPPLPPRFEVIEGGLEAIERELLEVVLGPDFHRLPDHSPEPRTRDLAKIAFRTPRPTNCLQLVGGTATTKVFPSR
jgi:hypothetical protein